jgi:hypothetical protein
LDDVPVNLPEPSGWITRPGADKPYEYSWHACWFDIDARADAVDVTYDFEGRMGCIDLLMAARPEQVEELAYMLLAAVAKARELKQ